MWINREKLQELEGKASLYRAQMEDARVKLSAAEASSELFRQQLESERKERQTLLDKLMILAGVGAMYSKEEKQPTEPVKVITQARDFVKEAEEINNLAYIEGKKQEQYAAARTSGEGETPNATH